MLSLISFLLNQNKLVFKKNVDNNFSFHDVFNSPIFLIFYTIDSVWAWFEFAN